jgi:hypothetical protein
MLKQLLQQKVSALGTLTLDDSGQGVHPLTGFLAVRVLREWA